MCFELFLIRKTCLALSTSQLFCSYWITKRYSRAPHSIIWGQYRESECVSLDYSFEEISTHKSIKKEISFSHPDFNKYYIRCTGKVWYPGVASCVCLVERLWKMIYHTYCSRGLLASVWLLCCHKDRLVEIFLLPHQYSEILLSPFWSVLRGSEVSDLSCKKINYLWYCSIESSCFVFGHLDKS